MFLNLFWMTAHKKFLGSFAAYLNIKKCKSCIIKKKKKKKKKKNLKFLLKKKKKKKKKKKIEL